jgi:hypothetical protein
MIELTSLAILLAATTAAIAAPDAAPKAPQEVTDMAKSLAGTWKCDGTAMGPDMKEAKMTATMKSKADLDGFWLHDSFEGTVTGMKYKMEAFTTYDAAAKKFRRTSVANDGALMTGTSDGMKDMKIEFDMDSFSPHGQNLLKDHVDASDLKKGVHAWGEVSMDKGKTWAKVYDETCKK